MNIVNTSGRSQAQKKPMALAANALLLLRHNVIFAPPKNLYADHKHQATSHPQCRLGSLEKKQAEPICPAVDGIITCLVKSSSLKNNISPSCLNKTYKAALIECFGLLNALIRILASPLLKTDLMINEHWHEST